MGRVKFQESKIELTYGRTGKVAIFMYSGQDDPEVALDSAVSLYADGTNHSQFVDIEMDNPGIRVVIIGINDMIQEDFDPLKHNAKS